MTNFDALAFYSLLWALYLFECSAWVRRDALLFIRSGSHFIFRRGQGVVQSAKGSLSVLSALPPMSAAFVAQTFPLSLGKDGISTHVIPSLHPFGRQAVERKVVAWQDINEVGIDGKKLTLNGRIFLNLGHGSVARWVCQQLEILMALSSEERAAHLGDPLEASLDVSEAQRRLDLFGEKGVTTQLLANLIFFQVFVLLPLLYFTGHLYPRWIYFVGQLFTLLLCNAGAFYLAHKKLHPLERIERISQSISYLMWPPGAMRSHDRLARHLFVGLHPTAVVQVLGDDDQVRALLALTVRDALFPLGDASTGDDDGDANDDDALARSIEENWADLHGARMQKLAAQLGLKKKKALLAPKKEGDALRAYCPRCHLQYKVQTGQCSDCAGVELCSF